MGHRGNPAAEEDPSSGRIADDVQVAAAGDQRARRGAVEDVRRAAAAVDGGAERTDQHSCRARTQHHGIALVAVAGCVDTRIVDRAVSTACENNVGADGYNRSIRAQHDESCAILVSLQDGIVAYEESVHGLRFLPFKVVVTFPPQTGTSILTAVCYRFLKTRKLISL